MALPGQGMYFLGPGSLLGGLVPGRLSLCEPPRMPGLSHMGENVPVVSGLEDAASVQISAVPHTGRQKSCSSRCCARRHMLV